MRLDKENVILSDPGVLTDTHLPPEIVARDRQIEEIGMFIGPFTDGRKPMNCWLYRKLGAWQEPETLQAGNVPRSGRIMGIF